MKFKRIIFTLLYSGGNFFLSRNFRLQKVGNIAWLKKNYSFGKVCEYVDEIMILLVTKNPSYEERKAFLADISDFRKKIFVPMTIGGGIKNLNDAKMYIDNGADKILINQLIHSNIKLVSNISKLFGSQALSVMADVKKENDNYFSYFDSGEKKSYEIKKYFEKIKNINFGELIINSINNDGTGFGFDKKIIKIIPSTLKNPTLLMGGAGKPEHFYEILKYKKIAGAVTANLFNFLGNGLELSRNFSIKKGIKIVKFSNLNEKNI